MTSDDVLLHDGSSSQSRRGWTIRICSRLSDCSETLCV